MATSPMVTDQIGPEHLAEVLAARELDVAAAVADGLSNKTLPPSST